MLTKNGDLSKKLEEYMKRYVVSCLRKRRIADMIEKAIAGNAVVLHHSIMLSLAHRRSNYT